MGHAHAVCPDRRRGKKKKEKKERRERCGGPARVRGGVERRHVTSAKPRLRRSVLGVGPFRLEEQRADAANEPFETLVSVVLGLLRALARLAHSLAESLGRARTPHVVQRVLRAPAQHRLDGGEARTLREECARQVDAPGVHRDALGALGSARRVDERVEDVRVQAIIVGTGGHFLIRLGSQNEWDGQRDKGPEDGTIVKGLYCKVYKVASSDSSCIMV